MGRKAKPELEKVVKFTITLDPALAEQVVKFSKIEMLPVSRFIARILKRFFEMK